MLYRIVCTCGNVDFVQSPTETLCMFCDTRNRLSQFQVLPTKATVADVKKAAYQAGELKQRSYKYKRCILCGKQVRGLNTYSGVCSTCKIR